MSKKSFIYRSLIIYRIAMNILYLGKYKMRFQPLIQQIQGLTTGTRILELCFGDVYLAEYCRKHGYEWTGIDINSHFVATARKLGFDARYADLAQLEVLPPADLCIMMGSLYHFHPDPAIILRKMFIASDQIVISEPVLNLSSQPGIVGFLAKRAASVGKGVEDFRYTRESFMNMLENNSRVIGYRIAEVEDHGKDLIVKLLKNAKY